MSNAPWSFGDARDACRLASKAQAAAEKEIRNAAREVAHLEEAYRVALAKKIVELHLDGTAWSVCSDIARGDEAVARLRRDRDVAEGVYKAMEHATWRHNQDRKDAQRFADWSMRREFAEASGSMPEWSEAA